MYGNFFFFNNFDSKVSLALSRPGLDGRKVPEPTLMNVYNFLNIELKSAKLCELIESLSRSSSTSTGGQLLTCSAHSQLLK